MDVRDFSDVESAIKARNSDRPNHLAVLTEILAAIARNDFAAIATHLTSDVELHISGCQFLDGSWKGQQTVLGAMAANFGKVTDQKSELDSMVQQGDTIAAMIREHGRLKEDGTAYRIRGVIWYSFAGDRLARVEEFFRTID